MFQIVKAPLKWNNILFLVFIMFWFAKIVDSDWLMLIVVQLHQDFLHLASMNNLIQCNFLNFSCQKLSSHLSQCEKLKLFLLLWWFYTDIVKLLTTSNR